MGRETLGNAKRLKQIKKYLFDNRKTLTEDDFSIMIDKLSQEIFEVGYVRGWDARSELYRICATARRIRMRKDYDEFYNEQVAAIGNVNKTKPLTLNQLERSVEPLWKDWM